MCSFGILQNKSLDVQFSLARISARALKVSIPLALHYLPDYRPLHSDRHQPLTWPYSEPSSKWCKMCQTFENSPADLLTFWGTRGSIDSSPLSYAHGVGGHPCWRPWLKPCVTINIQTLHSSIFMDGNKKYSIAFFFFFLTRVMFIACSSDIFGLLPLVSQYTSGFFLRQFIYNHKYNLEPVHVILFWKIDCIPGIPVFLPDSIWR